MKHLNYDIKEIYVWPVYMQFVLLVLAFFIVLYLFYLVDISNLHTRINTSRLQESELKVKLQQLIENQMLARGGLSQLSMMQKTLIAWQGKFTDAANLQVLIDQIVTLGGTLHIKFNLFSPENEIKENGFYKIPIKANIGGTYKQITHFISQLVNMQKVVVVSSFHILTPVSEKVQPLSLLKSDLPVQADLTIDIYRRSS